MESFFDSFLRTIIIQGIIFSNINREYWVEYQIDCGLINTIDTRVTGFDSKGAQRISFPCPSNLQSGLFPSTIKNKTKSHLAGDRGNDSRDRENNKPNRREKGGGQGPRFTRPRPISKKTEPVQEKLASSMTRFEFTGNR